jgi:hypothetical protein
LFRELEADFKVVIRKSCVDEIDEFSLVHVASAER